MTTKYTHFIGFNGIYKGVPADSNFKKLPACMYSLVTDQSGAIYFKEMKSTYDTLIDLPSPEFTQVVNEIELFLKPETKQSFADYGFIYKRSALLYGKPGTGKTCIINRLAEKVMKEGGVVLFNPDPRLCEGAFDILESIQPESTILVIFEEFDETLKRHESGLLSLLDGEVQKNNVIYLATTNYIDRVPARICRPGRFSSVIEVKYPALDAREFYLRVKKVPEAEITPWAIATEGFSIDDLKETVLATKCLNVPLPVIIERLGGTKTLMSGDKSPEDLLKDLLVKTGMDAETAWDIVDQVDDERDSYDEGEVPMLKEAKEDSGN